MSYINPESIEELKAGFEANWIPWIDLPDLLLPFLTQENIDRVMGELSRPMRDFFVEFALANYLEGGERIVLGRSDSNGPMRPEHALVAVRWWLREQKLLTD